jgi:large subunit ribosomal protein L17
MAFKELRDKEAVSELFRDVAGKVGERPGGYTRIIKLGSRLGDSADMCIIELVDYNENLLSEKAAARTKTARRRRGGKKKEQPVAAPVTGSQAEAAEPEPEAPESEPEKKDQ